MLNNITNFFNLIKTGKVKTQLDGTDLLPIGTKDFRFSGQYQPTMIKYSDLVAGLVGGSNGQVLFNDNDTIAGASNLYWDETNGRLGIGTSTPTNAVDITQTGGGFISLNRTAGASASLSITNIRTGGGQGLVFDTGSFSFRNTTLKHLILDSGRIGVNTNDDALTASFNVKGTGATSATKNILFKNSANTDLFTIWDDGAVGLNTSTNAGFAFDVNGTARVVGPTFAVGDWTSRSTSVYVRALTGGSENRGFFIGTGASNDGNVGSFTYQPTGNLLNIRSPYNSGTVALSFEGNTNSTQFHNTSGVVHSKIVSGTGNWLINTTTDAGYTLDVNGTARVVNDATFSRIATFNSSVVTGGTTTFLVRSNSNTQISVQENNRLNLGAAGGGITYNNVSFSLVPGSFYTFSYVPQNALDTYAFLLTANYTNVGAGGNSQGSMLRTAGSTATQVGNVTMNQIELKPTYNNTGGTTINRGIYYNPTLTSLTGTTHFAFHSTSGRVRFEGLPTSSAGLSSGDIWNDGGTLKIV